MEMMTLITGICGMVSLVVSGMIIVDKHFDRKEEQERQARRARQAEIAKLMGE